MATLQTLPEATQILPAHAPGSTASTIAARSFLYAVFKHRRLVVGVFVLVFLGSAIAALIRPRTWLASTEQLANDIRSDAGTPIGKVRIGSLPSTAHPLLTTVFLLLKQWYPLVQLSVREGQGATFSVRLPVAAADGSLVGIVTLDDLLRVLAGELGGLAHALSRGREREAGARRRLDAP